MKTVLAILIFAVLVTGCSLGYYSIRRDKDGGFKVTGLYDPAKGSPVISMGDGPPATQPSVKGKPANFLGWHFDFGSIFRTPSAGELANEQTKPLMFWGIVLVVAAGGLFIARGYFPLIPTSAATTTGILGAALIAASVFLPQVVIPWWAWLAALGAVLVIVLPGVASNYFKEKKSGAVDETPLADTEGQK